jgi:hypothetical protein
MFGRLLLLLRHWLCSTRRRKPEHPCDTPCRTARRIESWAIPSLLRATPSATSERLLGLLGSSPIPPSSSLLAFAFNWGHFPPPALPGFVGTTGLPSPHTARSGPRGLPVDRELRSPLRLPVLSSGLLCMHAVTITPAATDETCFAHAFHRLRPSPTVGRVGSCIGCFGACSVFTSHYGLLDSPSRLYATLYIRGSGSFVASATAPIASGWSEPVPGRDSQPAVDQRLTRRTDRN